MRTVTIAREIWAAWFRLIMTVREQVFEIGGSTHLLEGSVHTA